MIYTYKNIWKIAAPILIGLIIHQLIGTTDTIFLGRVGEIELGASALGGVFYIVVYMLGHGFSTGVQIIIARHNGEKKFIQIGQVFYQSFCFLMITAIILISLTMSFSKPLLSLFIKSPQILDATIAYINPRIWGLFFAFTIVNFRAFFVGITQTKVLTFNAIFMLLINLIFDYGLIFGNLGMPKLGISGSAIASVIAEVVSVFFFIIYLLIKINWKNFGFANFTWHNLKLLKSIFDLSFWTIMQSVIALATWMFFLIAIENLGERELAISNVLRNISSLMFMIIAALSTTANTLTGNLIGQKRITDIIPTVGRIIKLTYVIGVPLIIILVIFYKPVLAIYTNDTTLLKDIIWSYLAMHSSFLTLVPGMVWLSTISGTGQTKLGMIIELFCLALYTMAIWYVVIYLRADLAWCWLGELYYNIPLGIICWIYMKKLKKLIIRI